MKKLLWIKDLRKFWTIFSSERIKDRKKRSRLPYDQKIEIAFKIQRDIEKLKQGTIV